MRELCHAAKEGRRLDEIANGFIGLWMLNKNSIIIPVPNHVGYAEYTLKIAEIIAEATGSKVCDIVKCKPHEPIYNLKKLGQIPSVEFYLVSDPPEGDIYILDTVTATGYTMESVRRLLGKGRPLVYARDYTLRRQLIL